MAEGNSNSPDEKRSPDGTLAGEKNSSLSPDLTELKDQLRDHLREERERQGEGLNEFEYVRERLVNEKDLAEKRGERQQYYEQLITAFDALAYDRYTTDDTRGNALKNLARRGKREHITMSPQVSRSLEVVASTLAIPYTSEQLTIDTSPAALADLKKLGIGDEPTLLMGKLNVQKLKEQL